MKWGVRRYQDKQGSGMSREKSFIKKEKKSHAIREKAWDYEKKGQKVIANLLYAYANYTEPKDLKRARRKADRDEMRFY